MIGIPEGAEMSPVGRPQQTFPNDVTKYHTQLKLLWCCMWQELWQLALSWVPESVTDACSPGSFKWSPEAQLLLSTLDLLMVQVSLHPVFSWWLDFPSSAGTAVFWDVSWFLPSYFFSLFNTRLSPDYSTSSRCSPHQFWLIWIDLGTPVLSSRSTAYIFLLSCLHRWTYFDL